MSRNRSRTLTPGLQVLISYLVTLNVAVWCLIYVLSPTISTAAQTHYSPYTVNSGQVPSTQTDFPILVSISDARIKTVGNGGHVADAQGDDIRPYSDSSLSTAITGYEKVFYDGTNGILEMWVKIGSLSDGSVIYLGYGDTSLTSDASSTSTWSNNFQSVYHLKDGTTLSVDDARNTFNGTNHGATATTGKIDGGAAFASASSQYISNGDQKTAAMSLSVWAKGTSFPNSYNTTWGHNNNLVAQFFFLYVKSNGKLACACANSAGTTIAYDGTGSNTLSTDTWYHLAMTYDSTSGLIGYVNGSQDGTAAANGVLRTSNTSIGAIGANDNSAVQQFFWNGALDELHISSVARSPDWITIEYNQGSPSTFATLGTEVALTGHNGWFFFFPN